MGLLTAVKPPAMRGRSDWSVKAKSLVQEALASDKAASSDIVDIECRTTMCRVELANDGNKQAPKVAEIPMKIGEELPNVLVNQTNESDGSTTTVLYLSKDEFFCPIRAVEMLEITGPIV